MLASNGDVRPTLWPSFTGSLCSRVPVRRSFAVVRWRHFPISSSMRFWTRSMTPAGPPPFAPSHVRCTAGAGDSCLRKARLDTTLD